MKQWDLILAGGGLANGLIALRLLERQPSLKILMPENGPQPGGNHTWSFHQHDLTPEQHHWIAPLVAHRWDGYDVQFPEFTRTLEGGYLTVTSTQFAQVIRNLPGLHFQPDAEVVSLAPDRITLAGGEVHTARAVIDGRGYQPSPHLQAGFQSFLGQEWQLHRPHGLTRPILMDATVDQLEGYRFVYTLPLTADRVLIEDTHYIDSAALNISDARERIAAYAASKGMGLKTLLREEQGNLPITLAGAPQAYWQQREGQPCSGMRAGLFHPTTGYSLPLAAALADRIAAEPLHDHAALAGVIRQFALQQWQRQRFFRLLNRMLFLAGPPARRWRVMQRFYRLDDGLIARFYAGHPTLKDMARILTGKPPVPVGEALRAVLKHTPRLRAY